MIVADESCATLHGRSIPPFGGGRRGENGCITSEGFLDPAQTDEMLRRVSSGSLVPLRVGSGRASGLSDWRRVHPIA